VFGGVAAVAGFLLMMLSHGAAQVFALRLTLPLGEVFRSLSKLSTSFLRQELPAALVSVGAAVALRYTLLKNRPEKFRILCTSGTAAGIWLIGCSRGISTSSSKPASRLAASGAFKHHDVPWRERLPLPRRPVLAQSLQSAQHGGSPA
jgi:hypothetical protein